MDNPKNLLIIFGVFVLLFLWNKKNDIPIISNINKKLPSNEHTLIQLYQDENEGVAKFVGTPEGYPNQLLTPSGDLAVELGLDGLNATYGSVSIDLDKDGYSDLIVCASDGVWLYKNNLSLEKPFSSKKIMEKRPGLTPIDVVVHDFDRDGNLDLYIIQVSDQGIESAFLLRYMGNYEFVDVTSITGETRLRQIVSEIKSMKNGFLSDPVSNNQFVVKLPNTIEFASARVVLVNGLSNRVKYNLVGSGLGQNSTLIFAMKYGDKIDKVKIRTIYGKEYNYAEQKINSMLKVEPIVHFESDKNIWRSTSMG